MKSKRRHELQHNVLDAELGKVIGFLQTRGIHLVLGILAVVLIVVLIVTAVNSYHRKRYDLEVRFAQAITLVSGIEDSIASLEQLAGQDTDKRIAAMACATLADMYVLQTYEDQADVSPERKQSLIDQAVLYYRQVISDFPDQPVAVAKAHLGLGSLAESRGDFTQALAEYEAIRRIPDPKIQLVGLRAVRNLEALATRRAPVAMATTAPATPTTLPATGPRTLPATEGQQ